MVAESEKAARAAIERFDAAARRSLVSAEHRLLKALGVIAPEILSRLARRFDLSVLMQSEPGGVNNDDMIETSLFQSGRPLIVVPYIQKDGLKLDRVVCCWDGSRAAARAFNDAFPLLAKATSVHLLIVLNEKTNGEQRKFAASKWRSTSRAMTSRSKSKPFRRLTSTSPTPSCPMSADNSGNADRDGRLMTVPVSCLVPASDR